MYSYSEENDELYKIMMPDGSFLCWLMTEREAIAVCVELNKVKS